MPNEDPNVYGTCDICGEPLQARDFMRLVHDYGRTLVIEGVNFHEACLLQAIREAARAPRRTRFTATLGGNRLLSVYATDIIVALQRLEAEFKQQSASNYEMWLQKGRQVHQGVEEEK